MKGSADLRQYYYCRACDDFYLETGIGVDFQSYITVSLSGNIGYCPHRHQRSINKEDIVYLLEKPQKHQNCAVACLDIIGFSEKNSIEQFNNSSVLNASVMASIPDEVSILYKNTGDGFLIGFKETGVASALDFLERLIVKFLKPLPFIETRIGISLGTFFSYANFDCTTDLFGQTIIDASRIADFGHRDSVLLSERAARDLQARNGGRKESLQELGFCFDKHRKPYKVWNLRSEKVGSAFSA